MSIVPSKCCSRKEQCVHPGGPNLPATLEYFVPDKRKRDGFCAACRLCRYENRRRLYAEDPKRYKEYQRQHRLRPGSKEKEKERAKRWKADNPEKVKAYKRQEYYRHREQYRKQKRIYYQDNREKFLGRYHTPKGKAQILASNARRKARKRSLPDTFTADDWQRAIDYFDGCCAVCGRPPGLWHTLATDHWIPLALPDCPGTIPTNIIPLCGGQDGCNNSKRHKDPERWLIEQFGKGKAKVVLKRILDYFEWVRSQDE